MNFLLFSEFGEIADLGAYLAHVEKHHVVLHIEDKDHRRIYDGILPKTDTWWEFIGKGYVWVFDSCDFGNLQDWLRSIGEAVIGGSEKADELENDRALGQAWFEELGFDQPEHYEFTSIDDLEEFVEKHRDQRWILKQEGSAPKSLSHMGQFDTCEDMLFHIRELKKHWNETEFGEFRVQLMEVVVGTEIAASAFFNGENYLRNGEGKVVGYLNGEEKKESNEGLGETTGELGTVFFGVDEDNALFSSILLRDGVVEKLREIGFRGVIDFNCIVADDGRMVALEPTCRFGIPATSYECIEGMGSPVGELLSAMAKGINRSIEIYQSTGMVMCLVAKPFPLEMDVEDEATSLREKLWILEGGDPREEFTDEQRRHIHLWNFQKKEDEETGEVNYRVPTKSGYLGTVTGRGRYISTTRDNLIHYIKQNLYFPGLKYRTDIGKRLEQFDYEDEQLSGPVSR
jgi:phosphoribosylamine-glycine ligase